MEFERNIQVIQLNTDIIQKLNTHICGYLCLYVLKKLTENNIQYQEVLNFLSDDIHSLIGKLPRPKNGFKLPGHHYNPLNF